MYVIYADMANFIAGYY